MPQIVKSVLFFDYDSIYHSLCMRSLAAGDDFARQAAAWLQAIESGELITANGEPHRRRLLVKRCYADPRVLGDNRSRLVAAGVQIVDCPTQDGRPRSGADISMALDTIDALEHATDFEEFILLSAGSDLSPVLFRLRAHNRASVIYADANATDTYLAAADGAIAESGLIRLLGHPDILGTLKALEPPRREVIQLPQLPAIEVERTPSAYAIVTHASMLAEDEAEQSRDRTVVRSVPYASASDSETPLARDQRRAEVRSSQDGGGRQSQREELTALVRRMHQSTRVPLFSPRTFADLFRILATEVARNGYRFQVTAENVTNEMIAAGRNVTRRQVGFVVKGLALKGHSFSGRDTPDELARLFREQVLYLTRNANIELTEREIDLVGVWIGGGGPARLPEPTRRQPPATETPSVKRSVASPPQERAPPRSKTEPPSQDREPPVARPRAEKRSTRRLAEVPMPPRIVLPPITSDIPLPTPEPIVPTGPIAPRRPAPSAPVAQPAPPPTALAVPTPPAPAAPPPPAAAALPPAAIDRVEIPIARERTAASSPTPPATTVPRPPRPRQRDGQKRGPVEEAAPAPSPADDMESMILAAIAEAVEVKPTTKDDIEFHFDLSDTPPPPEPPAATDEPSTDIGEEIQRILSGYGQNRSTRGRGN